MEGRPRGKREKFPSLVNIFHVFPDLAIAKKGVRGGLIPVRP